MNTQNSFREILTRYGYTANDAVSAGINRNTLQKHLSGERNIGVKMALLYERLLHIPRYVLRPDLWEETTHAVQ